MRLGSSSNKIQSECAPFDAVEDRARRASVTMGGVDAGPSQWEHQAKFAGELFMGMTALVTSFLVFMYCHLKARRAERDRNREQRARLLDP